MKQRRSFSPEFRQEAFILDRHPAYPEISIAAGFSGHGYKFCSVIGEVMADLVQDERGRHDIGSVIPSAARDLAREWLESGVVGPSLRSG